MGKCLQNGCWEPESDSPACSDPTIDTSTSLAVLLPLLHCLSVPEALSPAHSTGRSWQEQAGAGSQDTRKQFIFLWKLTGTKDVILGQGVTGSAKRWGDSNSGCKEQDWKPSPFQGLQGTGSLSTTRPPPSRAVSRDCASLAGLRPWRSP